MKVGFLFGAGAEASYGLPSGGKFALDIFRQDASSSKEEFKVMRSEIDATSNYVYQWLPEDYISRNISSFGKTVFENIVKDTIEHGRDRIINNMNSLDDIAINEKEKLIKNYSYDIDEIIEKLIGKKIANCHMNAIVAFNDAFKEGNDIFKSRYFSALLEVYKKREILDLNERAEIGKIIISLLQLQIGALSENLTRRINDNIFSKKDDEIDLFDDLGEIIRLNYQATGLTGMEYLLEKKQAMINTDSGKILRFAQNLIETVYSSVLDYKSLIDSNWHYLYCPREEWGKFCKISIFLLTVRNYIINQLEAVNVVDKKGYYNDLADAIGEGIIIPSTIATTNYNSFIEQIIGQRVKYLNGAVTQWYDPFLNKIGTQEELNKYEKHFLVPLMFTQSGTKPMTSIHKSIEYVDMYKEWRNSDGIIIVGFGFNPDDEHINGIIRTLIDEDKKKIYVVSVASECEIDIQNSLAARLKVDEVKNINVIKVGMDGKTDKGIRWIDAIHDIIK